MSDQLYWLPADPSANTIIDEKLVMILQAKYRKKIQGGKRLAINVEDLPYLYGLSDAGIDRAKDLIKAILDHYEIEIYT